MKTEIGIHIDQLRYFLLVGYTVVGKIYEKVVVNRIQETYKEARLESSDQFGFKKGKKTDDTFISLRRAIK